MLFSCLIDKDLFSNNFNALYGAITPCVDNTVDNKAVIIINYQQQNNHINLIAYDYRNRSIIGTVAQEIIDINYTSDNELSIPINISNEGKILTKSLKNIKDKEIKLSINNNVLEIISSKTSLKLSIIDIEPIYKLHKELFDHKTNNKYILISTINGKLFKTILNKGLMCVDSNSFQQHITSNIYFYIMDHHIHIMGTNGIVLGAFKLINSINYPGNIYFSISSSFITNSLCALILDNEDINIKLFNYNKASYIILYNSSVIIRIEVYMLDDNEFYDYKENHFSIDYKINFNIQLHELLNGIKFIMSSNIVNNPICLDIVSKDILELSNSKATQNIAKYKIDIMNYSGYMIDKIYFDPRLLFSLLTSFIDKTDKYLIKVEMEDINSVIRLFHNDNQINKMGVIAPLDISTM